MYCVESSKIVIKLLRKIVLISLLLSPVLFAAKSQQILEKYCYDCHSDGVDKGGIDFDVLFKMKGSDPKTKKMWHKVWEVIEKEQMPPSDKKTQPKDSEREQLLIAIESGAFRIKRNQRYAGKVELVRMSNYQYGNTVASLTSVYGTENELPLDPTSAGFDNIGSTLSISPLLFDRYQGVAKRVSFEMLSPDSRNGGAKKRGSDLLKRSGDGKDHNKALAALNDFAKHAFRRPVNDREKYDIKKLYTSLRKTHNHH